VGRAGFVAVCLTVFVDMVGLTIVLVGLPFRALELGASGVVVGALVTCYSLGQFVSAPVLGALSDRFGRRPVLLSCLLGSSVAAVLTGLAPSVGTLAAARLFAGACAGTIGIAYAYTADATPRDQLTRAMGRLGASIGAAFVIGPAIGAAAAGAGFTATTWIAAALAFANLVLASLTLPETRAPGPPGETVRRGSPIRMLTAMRSRAEAVLLLGSVLGTLAFTAMESTLALLAAARFAMTPREVGALLAAAGVVMVVLQAAGVHRIARRFGPAAVATAGLVTMAASLLAVPLVPAAGLAAALCLLCAGYGLTGPTLATLLSSAADTHTQGAVLGANQAAMSLARVAGPLAAGAAFDATPTAPYLLAAATATVAAAIVATWSIRHPQPTR
jgi:DHA1 family tetracycline resistance protein-like MFS transporter